MLEAGGAVEERDGKGADGDEALRPCDELNEWLNKQIGKGKSYNADGMTANNKQCLVCRECSMPCLVYRDARNKEVTFAIKDYKSHTKTGSCSILPTGSGASACISLEGTPSLKRSSSAIEGKTDDDDSPPKRINIMTAKQAKANALAEAIVQRDNEIKGLYAQVKALKILSIEQRFYSKEFEVKSIADAFEKHGIYCCNKDIISMERHTDGIETKSAVGSILTLRCKHCPDFMVQSKCKRILPSIVLHLGLEVINEDSVERECGFKFRRTNKQLHALNMKQTRLTSLTVDVSIYSAGAYVTTGQENLCTGYRPNLDDPIEKYLYENHPVYSDGHVYQKEIAPTVILKYESDRSINTTMYPGGFRSLQCCKASPLGFPLPNFMCYACTKIPQLREYRRKRKMAQKDVHDVPSIRRPIASDFTSNHAKRIKMLRRTNRSLVLTGLALQREVWRLLDRKSSLLQRLEEDADLKQVVMDLLTAREKGLLRTADLEFKLLQDTCKNRIRQKGGKRWSLAVKQYMAIGRFKGGGRVLRHMTNGIHIGERTVERYIAQHSKVFHGGQSKSSLEMNLAEIASDIEADMKRLGIAATTVIPCIAAFDETPVLKKASVASQTALSGFCCHYSKVPGVKAAPCTFGEGLTRVLEIQHTEDVDYCFDNYKIGSYVHLGIISVLWEGLKDYAVVLASTCNTFTGEALQTWWDGTFVPVFERTVGKVLNYALPLGAQSDGDARRMSEYWKRGMESHLKAALVKHNLVQLSPLQFTRGDRLGFFEAHGSDFKHILKNWANQARSATRWLQIGTHKILLNHVKIAQNGEEKIAPDCIDDLIHNLVSEEALERADKMHVRHVLDHCTTDVIATLDKYPGTQWYLQVMLYYRMMYDAIHIPMDERVIYCGYVLTSMFGWFSWKEETNMTAQSFLTMETFRNTIISCCCWVNQLHVIRSTTDCTSYECHRCSSNYCECVFRNLVGFGNVEAGKRDANFKELCRLLSVMHTTMSWNCENMEARSKNHDPERSMMESSEDALLLRIGLTRETSTKTSISAFDVNAIPHLLDRGYTRAVGDLQKVGVGTEIIIDYSKVQQKVDGSFPLVSTDEPEDQDGNTDIATYDAELLNRFLTPGSRCEGRYDSCRYWLQATVTARTTEGHFTLKYQDGSEEYNVMPSRVRPFIEYSVGEKVASVFRKKWYYNAEIKQCFIGVEGKEDNFKIEFDDRVGTKFDRSRKQIGRVFNPYEVRDYTDLIMSLPAADGVLDDENPDESAAADILEQIIIDDDEEEAALETLYALQQQEAQPRYVTILS